MHFPGALARYSRISGGVRTGWLEAERSEDQVFRESESAKEETKRHF